MTVKRYGLGYRRFRTSAGWRGGPGSSWFMSISRQDDLLFLRHFVRGQRGVLHDVAENIDGDVRAGVRAH